MFLNALKKVPVDVLVLHQTDYQTPGPFLEASASVWTIEKTKTLIQFLRDTESFEMRSRTSL